MDEKKSILQKACDGLTKVNKVISYIAVVPMVLVMLIAVADIIGGKVFGHSIQSSTEIIQYLNIPLVCLAMGYVEHSNGHTRINVLTNLYPKVIQKLLYLLGSLVGCVVSFYVAYMAIQLLINNFERSTPIQSTSPILVWPFVGIMMLGFVLTGLSFLWSGIRKITQKDKPQASAGETKSEV